MESWRASERSLSAWTSQTADGSLCFCFLDLKKRKGKQEKRLKNFVSWEGNKVYRKGKNKDKRVIERSRIKREM